MRVFRPMVGPAALAFFGALLSLLFAPIVMLAWTQIQDTLDERSPPVVTSLFRIDRIDPNTVQVQIYVTRNRDCDFVKVTAFTGKALLDMRSACVRRADCGEPVSYPVGITILSQPWVISPMSGPVVQMYGYYDCNDRLVKVKLLDEVLK